MSATETEPAAEGATISLLPFYYGWVMVVIGALAMVATLPGRTHGLGMITERLLSDSSLELDRVTFGKINTWATLFGATFCLACGSLIDRYGIRIVLAAVILCLTSVVIAMPYLAGLTALFVAIFLTRGFGQSALSVVSITLVGKWFVRRLSVAMGLYSVLVALGFGLAFRLAKTYKDADWRDVWSGMGFGLLVVMLPLAWFLVRNSPEACGLAADGVRDAGEGKMPAEREFTLFDALATPAFWVFGIATSLYGLIASGTSLFNESILAERGFPKDVFYDVGSYTPLISLASNLAGGWIARRWSIARLTAVSMVIMAGSLFWLPHVTSYAEVIGYAAGMGISGGIVTVVFFTVWGQLYGRAHLGNIQGAAQMLTVIASAVGPELLARCQAATGSYTWIFQIQAGAAAAVGVAAWCVPLPRASETGTTESIT